MKIQSLGASYLNVSGEIYGPEFINLAHIEDDKIRFDDRTLFLSNEEKERLNRQPIKRYDDAVYVFNYSGRWGILANLPIDEYKKGHVKSHELVLPNVIQGMLSNLHGYNAEAAPVLLAHEKKIDFERIVAKGQYSASHLVGPVTLYVYQKDYASELLGIFQEIDELYIGDGHHRLYVSSLSEFKSNVFSCLISFADLNILSINRRIGNISNEKFSKSLDFLEQKFEVSETAPYTLIPKGFVRMTYLNKSYLIKLIDLIGDSFWNNDIYRLNTQIISQAFRVFSDDRISYLSPQDTIEEKKHMNLNQVLLETAPLEKDDFINAARSGTILPPKSTWMDPKFPSFLVMSIYQFGDVHE